MNIDAAKSTTGDDAIVDADECASFQFIKFNGPPRGHSGCPPVHRSRRTHRGSKDRGKAYLESFSKCCRRRKTSG